MARDLSVNVERLATPKTIRRRKKTKGTVAAVSSSDEYPSSENEPDTSANTSTKGKFFLTK